MGWYAQNFDGANNAVTGSKTKYVREGSIYQTLPAFGSIYVLWPRTGEARTWFDANVDVIETWGEGIVCEPHHVQDIARGLDRAGFDLVWS